VGAGQDGRFGLVGYGVGDDMRVLSLFDGISCGQLALHRAGVPVSAYFASEVDKHAITVTQRNWPNTIQLGDVRNVHPEQVGPIDILIGGSPCQGFSNAGKGLGFDDPRSQLFFEYVRLLGALKPRWFLLENVRMKQHDQNIITALLGVAPVKINSADFSAQNRERLYWTNIPVAPSVDRGILLADILEIQGDVDRDKSYCIDANYHKGGNLKSYAKGRRQLVFPVREKSNTLRVGGRGSPPEAKQCWDSFAMRDGTFRKLTVTECERLQTLPDGYTEGVSNTQRYRAIGNGWTVDVIAHILRGIQT
jgi:DNA (cytosine-5)-methyltransferase 3A